MRFQLDSFLRILDAAQGQDVVKVESQGMESGRAAVKIERLSSSDVKHYSMDWNNVNLAFPPIPEYANFQASINIPSEEYRSMIDNLTAIGDSIVIFAEGRHASFSVKGDVGDISLQSALHIRDRHDETAPITIIESHPVSMAFPGVYLQNFGNSSIPTTDVTLFVERDNPVAVIFKLEGGFGLVRYFLAPLINQDDALHAYNF